VALILMLNRPDCGFYSGGIRMWQNVGIAWISSNGEVPVEVSDPYGGGISKRLHSEPPIELTCGAPKMSSYRSTSVPTSQSPLGLNHPH
jgi:hypothetical protein